jgi:hypothetical protein
VAIKRFVCLQHISSAVQGLIPFVLQSAATTVTFKIPAGTPSGDYLFRVEHIGLHVAQSVGGAQFYISCGQITVTGGGSGTPGPLVAFPGAYSATDPGILLDIYYPIVGPSFSGKGHRE